MIEGFLSGLIGNVLKELVTQVIVRKFQPLDKKEVEKIVAAQLAQQPTAVQTPTIVKEVYIILGPSGFVDPSGQITIPSLYRETATDKIIQRLLKKSEVSSRLIFYDRKAGQGEIYRVEDRGKISLLREYNWRTSWTQIIPIHLSD